MTRAKKGVNFEKALSELEGLVVQMEDGDMSLEDSLKAFEKGIKLTRDCQKSLSEAEQKVQLLIEENDSYQTVEIDPLLDDEDE